MSLLAPPIDPVFLLNSGLLNLPYFTLCVRHYVEAKTEQLQRLIAKLIPERCNITPFVILKMPLRQLQILLDSLYCNSRKD